MPNIQYPIEVPAIRVEQPLGEFFAVALSAEVLLDVAYSNPLRLTDVGKKVGWLQFFGGQRSPDVKRFQEIARFINGTEAAFPNSIILGANYTKDGEYVGDADNRDSRALAWTVTRKSTGDYRLKIPSSAPIAAIVDGQHRLGAFRDPSVTRKDMSLLCAVYLDLPIPYQAYLFATINFNQKKVDKSQAYELYGFDLESEAPECWTPEKLAVFLCRRLNVEDGSPFWHQIRVAAENREELGEEIENRISTATVVEGILGLISQNPKADRDAMLMKAVDKGRSRNLLKLDKAPLRKEYLALQDAVIYTAVKNYFLSVKDLIWSQAEPSSYIVKTVGVQALFDILRLICHEFESQKDLSIAAFSKRTRPASDVDYSDSFFQASGKGRIRLKNVIRLRLKLATLGDLPEPDREEYERFE